MTTEDIVIGFEQQCLGTILHHPDIMPAVCKVINSADFLREVDQEIFIVMKRMAENGMPFEPITLYEEWVNTKSAENADSEYCKTLWERRGPTSWYAVFSAKKIKMFSNQRRLITVSRKFADAVVRDDSDVEKLCGIMLDEMYKLKIDSKEDPTLAAEILEKYWDDFQERKTADDSMLYSSGFPSMDKLFGKLGKTQFIVMKGRRGSGKTQNLVNLGMRCALNLRTSVIFTMEMSQEEYMNRCIAYSEGIDSRTMRHISEESEKALSSAIGNFSELPLRVIAESKTVSEMVLQCREFVRQGADIGFIGVDYIELVKAEGRHGNRELELAQISRDLRQMASTFNTTVLVLSQTNKDGAERGSESIGNAADLLVEWKQEPTTKGYQLVSEKNRFGPRFMIHCNVDFKTSRIFEETTE